MDPKSNILLEQKPTLSEKMQVMLLVERNHKAAAERLTQLIQLPPEAITAMLKDPNAYYIDMLALSKHPDPKISTLAEIRACSIETRMMLTDTKNPAELRTFFQKLNAARR